MKNMTIETFIEFLDADARGANGDFMDYAVITASIAYIISKCIRVGSPDHPK
jgi:hypothetical protein